MADERVRNVIDNFILNASIIENDMWIYLGNFLCLRQIHSRKRKICFSA